MKTLLEMACVLAVFTGSLSGCGEKREPVKTVKKTPAEIYEVMETNPHIVGDARVETWEVTGKVTCVAKDDSTIHVYLDSKTPLPLEEDMRIKGITRFRHVEMGKHITLRGEVFFREEENGAKQFEIWEDWPGKKP